MRNQIEPLSAVELPQDKQVRKALNVPEPRLELAQQFNRAFGIVLGAQTLGNRRSFMVGL